MVHSTPLATYIKAATSKLHHESMPLKPIFGAEITGYTPTLKHGRVNRVLLYPGCFNPPHKGHLALLTQGYHRSGSDLNIVAAIVIPLNNEMLSAKFGLTGENLQLSQHERVRLWRGHRPSSWFWVYDETLKKDWGSFQRALVTAATSDGFNLEFALLCGPDHVAPNVISPHAWGCNTIVVGEADRPATFNPILGLPPQRLQNCHPWELVPVDERFLRRDVEKRAKLFLSGTITTASGITKNNYNRGKIWMSMPSQNISVDKC